MAIQKQFVVENATPTEMANQWAEFEARVENEVNQYVSYAVNARSEDGQLLGEDHGDGDRIHGTVIWAEDNSQIRVLIGGGVGVVEGVRLLTKALDWLRTGLGNQA